MAFLTWFERAKKNLDVLGNRIEALSGRSYYGAAFHGEMVTQFKAIQAQFSADPVVVDGFDFHERMLMEIEFSMLHERVVKAEKSLH